MRNPALDLRQYKALRDVRNHPRQP